MPEGSSRATEERRACGIPPTASGARLHRGEAYDLRTRKSRQNPTEGPIAHSPRRAGVGLLKRCLNGRVQAQRCKPDHDVDASGQYRSNSVAIGRGDGVHLPAHRRALGSFRWLKHSTSRRTSNPSRHTRRAQRGDVAFEERDIDTSRLGTFPRLHGLPSGPHRHPRLASRAAQARPTTCRCHIQIECGAIGSARLASSGARSVRICESSSPFRLRIPRREADPCT